MFSLERRSGRSKWSLEYTDFLLFLRCWAQVSRLSKVRPRYLTTGVVGIKLLLNETGGQSPGLREKVIKEDLESFIFIFHFFDQIWIKFRWFCNLTDTVCGLSFEARIIVSSAYVPNDVCKVFGVSCVNMVQKVFFYIFYI